MLPAVLKGIGILLLVLLGLVFFLLLALLFAPFRYHIRGSYLEDVPEGTVTVRWMGPAVNFRAAYRSEDENPISAVLKVFGIRVKDFAEGVKEEEAEGPLPSEKAEDTSQEPAVPAVISEDEKARQAQAERDGQAETAGQKKTESPEGTEGGRPEDPGAPKETAQAGKETGEESGEDGILGQAAARYRRLEAEYQRIIQAVQQRTEAIRKLWKMYTAEKNRAALEFLKKKILQILNALRPRSGEVHVRFGTGDPFSTGQVLEAMTMMYPQWGKYVEVEPDFLEAVHDINGELKGRVFLFLVLEAGLRVFFHKRLRAMYKKTKEIVTREILGEA